MHCGEGPLSRKSDEDLCRVPARNLVWKRDNDMSVMAMLTLCKTLIALSRHTTVSLPVLIAFQMFCVVRYYSLKCIATLQTTN